jgi:hypothetical protein
MTRAATRPRMNKDQSRHTRELRHRQQQRQAAPRVTSDRAIYGGVILIGFFGTVLSSLFAEVHWSKIAVLYVALIAYILNAATLAIFRGRHIPNWQQALARVPLRVVGYGTKHGKPLEAAHGQTAVLNAFFVSLLISVMVVGGLGVWAFLR